MSDTQNNSAILISNINDVQLELSNLKQNSPDVINYLTLMERANELEEKIREYVEGTGSTAEYYSVTDDSPVRISPMVRTKYNVVLDDVINTWGDKYTKLEADVKAMEKSPECAAYMESVKSETISSMKRKIKAN